MHRCIPLPLILLFASIMPAQSAEIERRETDLLIVGGTESGWAAAVQAARMGVHSITIVHDGHWLGGQFTEQALACVDENKGVGKVGWGVDWHPMKRSFHRSGLFLELMTQIESLNAKKYGHPMPGRPYHGPSTFRPAEAEAVFRSILQPYMDRGQVTLILDKYPVAANVDSSAAHPRLQGLSFAPLDSDKADLVVHADLTIDASDWGEAIQVSGAAFECGPDPKSRYQEPSAPIDLDDNPANEMNPITWAMIVEQSGDGIAKPIERPARYDDRCFARTSKISLAAMRDLKWDRPVRLGSIDHWPDRDQQQKRQLSIYNVRRLVEGAASREKQTVVLLNYMLGQDYPLERLPRHVVHELEADQPGASSKNIVRMSRRQRDIVFADARRHSLCLLHHLQTYVHDRADDTANSFRHFVLSEEFGTKDRLPPKPYIRESLRLKAMYMMREQDGRNIDGATKTAAQERFAQVMYPDGLLCWQFHYDFHRTGRAFLKDEGSGGPWIDFEKPGRHTHHMSDRSVFPLRSLIPEAMDGLMGAQKNLGYSSIVCAAIRLHDQCIAIGQAAGATAAIALKHQVAPRKIPYDRDRLEQVRHGLCGGAEGQPLLLWPFRDVSPEQTSFVAVNRLAALGIRVAGDYQVDFQPDAPASPTWRAKMQDLAQQHSNASYSSGTESDCTRGEFCVDLWRQVQSAGFKPFVLKDARDADLDGIANRDDPTPFTHGPVVTWAVREALPNEDGIPNPLDESIDPADVRQFNFGPRQLTAVPGFLQDYGNAFDQTLGYGWMATNTANSRRRNTKKGVADSFVFTRQAAQWECDLANGSWTVTLCVGDAAHPQPGQKVRVEGQAAVSDVDTAAGRFHEVSLNVDVSDGRLTVELGPQAAGQNTCLNWLRITPRHQR